MSALRVLFIAAATGGLALAWYKVILPAFEARPLDAISLTMLCLFGYVLWLREGMK